MHPIFFGSRRRGKLKPGRRSSRLRMLPRKLALAWLRRLAAVRVAAARLNEMPPIAWPRQKFLAGLDRMGGPSDDRFRLWKAENCFISRRAFAKKWMDGARGTA